MSGRITSDMTPDGYRPRIVDEQIARYQRIFGAIEIAGTKWCGKTWSARAHAASITYVDRNNNLSAAKADPSLMLLGERPHVIDEWQLVPAIWDEVRHRVDDDHGAKGQWLLTGSSTPQGAQGPQHSGAGRIGRIRMSPMSLVESGISSGVVSLRGLFEHRFEAARSSVDTRGLLEAVCRGGWPEAHDMPVADAQILIREYLRLTLTESVARLGKSPDIAQRLMGSLARNISQPVTFRTLRKDMYGAEENLDDFVSERTVSEYTKMFEDMFVIDQVRGWVPPARDPKRLQTKPRRYFADPSIAAAALGMNPSALIDDWQTFGFLFENLCVRDLLVYARALPDIGMEPVRYYHDDSGLECDAIVELVDGRWGGIEIKTSEDKVPEANASLLRLKEKLLKNPGARVKEPEFLAVLVGVGEFAYRQDNGIYVIPVGVLGV
ncbi:MULTISPECIES: ATP-binding protein [Bifidobacterium]|uniref:ATP-binding protein n=1 Tax=Bifidobacterium TaxID=1678 RepID=UPI001BDD09D7|nr:MULTISPECIES: DUF4143 domain-containing protein [Bifidobacterium]MBT1161473.1 DUF4143 domain-containing protein [Bifidobacterium sp. SO1]MBW3079659.1 DUF4143 domain-containing protein [Bifidobacterium simiiventris]